jgi:penicillin-binding protein 1A
MDAPISLVGANGQAWNPENYEGKYYGPLQLRKGLELSRNTMTVRLAQGVGMAKISTLAERMGVTKHMDRVLAMALGSGETTVFKLAAAYSSFVNGGKKVEPHLIEMVQDREGQTIFKADHRDCDGCKAGFSGAESPRVPMAGEQMMDPITAYQITSMLQGVVQRGTAAYAVGAQIDKPLAGKTGTSQDAQSTWFIGFSPDLVVGVYMGYDKPRNLGRTATGGHLAAPIARDFMKVALADKPATPFRIPAGIKLVRVDSKTGMRAGPGDTGKTILEAFKPGTAPPDNYAVIGVADQDGRQTQPLPDADRSLFRPGTGGLY